MAEQDIFAAINQAIPSLGLGQVESAQQVGVDDLRQQLLDMLMNPQEAPQAPAVPMGANTVSTIGDAFSSAAAALTRNPGLRTQFVRRLQERRAFEQQRLDQQSQRERQGQVQALGLQLGAEQEGLRRTTRSKERAEAAETRQGDIAREERRFDEVERGSLEKEARGMGVFKPNMTDDELGAAISSEAKRRADAALGADSSAQFEQGRVLGEDILNAFLFGDPDVGPSISERLASGQTPEDIMFEFQRRLAPLMLDPVRRAGLEAILRQKLEVSREKPKPKSGGGLTSGAFSGGVPLPDVDLGTLLGAAMRDARGIPFSGALTGGVPIARPVTREKK